MKLKHLPSLKKNKWDTDYFTLQGVDVETLALILGYALDAMQAKALHNPLLNPKLIITVKELQEFLNSEDHTVWQTPLNLS